MAQMPTPRNVNDLFERCLVRQSSRFGARRQHQIWFAECTVCVFARALLIALLIARRIAINSHQ